MDANSGGDGAGKGREAAAAHGAKLQSAHVDDGWRGVVSEVAIVKMFLQAAAAAKVTVAHLPELPSCTRIGPQQSCSAVVCSEQCTVPRGRHMLRSTAA